MLTACITRAEVYTPRCPCKNQYYRCVEAHFEESPFAPDCDGLVIPLHSIARPCNLDGCFYGDGEFMTGISPNAADLEAAFTIEVFGILKKEGKINRIVIDNMNTWQHSGFNVYCGPPVGPWDDDGVERLAQYTVLAPFSQETFSWHIPADMLPC